MGGLPRPIPLGQIAPRSSRAQLPQDRVHHLTVITSPATPLSHRRQQRQDPTPSTIRELTSTNHTSIIANTTPSDPQDTP